MYSAGNLGDFCYPLLYPFASESLVQHTIVVRKTTYGLVKSGKMTNAPGQGLCLKDSVNL